MLRLMRRQTKKRQYRSSDMMSRLLRAGLRRVVPEPGAGAMGGDRCMISPRYLIFNDIRLRGFWLSQWFKTARAEKKQALFAELAGLVADGTLHARIQASYGIDHVREAVQAAASGARDGKIVIEPNGPSRAAI